MRNCCRRHCTVNNIALGLTVLGIISSTITIFVFSSKLINLSAYDYIYAYKASICRPISGRAFNLSCQQDDQPVTRWMSVLLLQRGLETVENPFAMRQSRLEAIADRDKVEMFSNYSCLCRTVTISNRQNKDDGGIVKGCSWWPSCILNADFIHYMQRDNDRYYQTYISFIVASSVSLVLAIIGVPFSVAIIRRSVNNQYIPLK